MKKINFYDESLGKRIEAEIISEKECNVYFTDKKPLRAFVCELTGDYRLYSCEDWHMACFTRDEISDGMDLYYVQDVDTFVTSMAIRSMEDLKRFARL